MAFRLQATSAPMAAPARSNKTEEWPLRLYREGVERVRGRSRKQTRGTYPFRMMRYWFTACIVEHELRRTQGPLRILDLGCERGISRDFCHPSAGLSWIGLDMNERRLRMLEGMYDELHCRDFNETLPLAPNSADVAIFQHVAEHLPRPEFSLAEIARVLRPGGVLVAGSPVLPKLIASVREAQFRKELAEGTRKPGKHVNVYWPSRWRDSLDAAGMDCEVLHGGYLLRWQKNPLENQAWWVRINQIWGRMFPALSGEVLVVARKRATA